MRSCRARAGRTVISPALSRSTSARLAIVSTVVVLVAAACSTATDGAAIQVDVDAGSSATTTTTLTSTTDGGADSGDTATGDTESETAGDDVALPQPSDTIAGDTGDDVDGEATDDADNETPTTTAPAPAAEASAAPDWLGQRVLPTDAAGVVPPQTTPPEFLDRRLITIDTLPRPSDDAFLWEVSPLAGDPLARSTWNETCPVTVDDLRYVRTTFWGFDGLHHQGELILHHEVVDDIRSVFAALHEVRFPIEEMRITEPWELDAPPTGDGNNTGAFVCREVVGGSGTFSQHAYGLAVDINPFHNPYRKGDVVLPELATDYLDRGNVRPGMFFEGGPVVNAFDAIGWGWGGRWQSLDDYHHFSRNNR